MKDVVKDSVLAMFNGSDLGTVTVVVTIGVSAFFGLLIYVLYRLMAKDSFYSRDLNKTMALLPIVTAGIVLAMQSNLVVSLGMVGALSIVRFRTPIKNPIDLAFLFLSISMGILCGAQLYELAVFTVLGFAAFLFVLDLLPTFRAPCLLVIRAQTADAGVEAEIAKCIRKHTRSVRLRNRSISGKDMEMIYEVRLRNEAQLVREAAALAGVSCVNLISHDGELRV